MGEHRYSLGDPLVDSYLAFVAGRSRPHTLRAVAHDLKTFFGVVEKVPGEVTAADVFGCLAHQRGDRRVVRITDGESGLSARTIARRLSSVSGFYAYEVVRGSTARPRDGPAPTMSMRWTPRPGVVRWWGGPSGYSYANVTALEVPASVSMVRDTSPGGPDRAGTVTMHDVSVGQLVGASWPWKNAWTRPSGLNRLAPDTVTTCPATPLTGARDSTVGRLPTTAGGLEPEDGAAAPVLG
jgi:uncharacterized protein YndB with AHSA1/START domain